MLHGDRSATLEMLAISLWFGKARWNLRGVGRARNENVRVMSELVYDVRLVRYIGGQHALYGSPTHVNTAVKLASHGDRTKV